jgi:hypothetical protein
MNMVSRILLTLFHAVAKAGISAELNRMKLAALALGVSLRRATVFHLADG